MLFKKFKRPKFMVVHQIKGNKTVVEEGLSHGKAIDLATRLNKFAKDGENYYVTQFNI